VDQEAARRGQEGEVRRGSGGGKEGGSRGGKKGARRGGQEGSRQGSGGGQEGESRGGKKEDDTPVWLTRATGVLYGVVKRGARREGQEGLYRCPLWGARCRNIKPRAPVVDVSQGYGGGVKRGAIEEEEERVRGGQEGGSGGVRRGSGGEVKRGARREGQEGL